MTSSNSNPAPAGLGHNEPPLEDRLALDFAEHVAAIEDVASKATEAFRAIPGGKLRDDADLETVAALVKAASDLRRANDSHRTKEKAPFLEGGRKVDGYFKFHDVRLERVMTTLNKSCTVFLREKADKERRDREETARLEREAREAAMREAERLDADNRRDEADRAIEEAQQSDIAARVAEREAAARPAELARTHHAAGMTTLRTVWKGEIDNFAQLSPAEIWSYLPRADIEKAIAAAVRNGVRTMSGVRIFEDSVAATR